MLSQHITVTIAEIDEIDQKLRDYQGKTDLDRENIEAERREILRDELDEYATQNLAKATESKEGDTLRYHLGEVIDASTEYLRYSGISEHLRSTNPLAPQHEANNYHRRAKAYQLLAQDIAANGPTQSLRYRLYSYQDISKAYALMPEHKEHKQRCDTYQENYRLALIDAAHKANRLCKQLNTDADKNKNDMALREKFVIQRERTIGLYKELLNLCSSNNPKHTSLASDIAHQLAFHYCGIALQVEKPQHNDHAAYWAIYEMMARSFDYIELACRLMPNHRGRNDFRSHLAGKFIGFVKIRVGIAANIGEINKALAAALMYSRLLEVLNSPPAEQADACHAVSSYSTQLKQREIPLSEAHLELTKQAYDWAEKAYRLNPITVHQKGYLLICEAYGKNLLTKNSQQAQELLRESMRLNVSEKGLLDPKTMAFCHSNLGRLALNEADATKQASDRLPLLKEAHDQFANAVQVTLEAKQQPSFDDQHMLTELNLQIGRTLDNIYANSGNPQLLDEAKQRYTTAAEIAKKNAEPRKEASAYRDLGQFYKFHLRDDVTAAKYFKKSIDLLIPALQKDGVLGDLDLRQQNLLTEAQQAWNARDDRRAMHLYLDLGSELLRQGTQAHHAQRGYLRSSSSSSSSSASQPVPMDENQYDLKDTKQNEAKNDRANKKRKAGVSIDHEDSSSSSSSSSQGKNTVNESVAKRARTPSWRSSASSSSASSSASNSRNAPFRFLPAPAEMEVDAAPMIVDSQATPSIAVASPGST